MKWSYWNQYNTFHNQPFDSYSKEKSDYITDNHNKGSKELGWFLGLLMVKSIIKVHLVKSDFFMVRLIRLATNRIRSILGKPSLTLKDTTFTRMLSYDYQAKKKLSLLRTAINAGGLLIGTVETTSQAVAQIIQRISQQPDLLKEARKHMNSDSDEFYKLVFEIFRFVPISSYLFRVAVLETKIAAGTDRETVIKKGQIVLAITGSAMFDEEAHQNPSQVDIHRETIQHYQFSYGAHECLGKYIAEVMVVEMVRCVLLQTPMEHRLDYRL